MIGVVAELRAVVIDWGGVLTQPMVNTVRAWITADQIDWDRYVAVVGPWLKEAYEPTASAEPTVAAASIRCTRWNAASAP